MNWLLVLAMIALIALVIMLDPFTNKKQSNVSLSQIQSEEEISKRFDESYGTNNIQQTNYYDSVGNKQSAESNYPTSGNCVSGHNTLTESSENKEPVGVNDDDIESGYILLEDNVPPPFDDSF